MKKWYSFYALAPESYGLLQNLSEQIDSDSIKLHQVGAEMSFPTVFGFVPWRHHVEIISRCKSVEGALFYVQKTIEEGLSRSALIDIIKADLYHNFGAAITNFSERLPAVQGKLAQQIMKDTYDLSFVSLPRGYDEDALEEALEKNS